MMLLRQASRRNGRWWFMASPLKCIPDAQEYYPIVGGDVNSNMWSASQIVWIDHNLLDINLSWNFQFLKLVQMPLASSTVHCTFGRFIGYTWPEGCNMTLNIFLMSYYSWLMLWFVHNCNFFSLSEVFVCLLSNYLIYTSIHAANFKCMVYF